MGRTLTRLALALLLLVTASASAAAGKGRGKPALADTKKADIAREHTKRGYALYQEGKYLDAAKAFEEAYAARPDPGLLYNAAQAARLGNELRKAQTLYSSYVHFHPDGANLGDAKVHLEKIEAAIQAEEEARKTPAVTEQPQPPRVEQTPVTEPSPRPSDEPRAAHPVYKKWWFWTAIIGGAAVVATGVTLGIVLTRPEPAWNNVGDIGPGAPATTNGVLQLRF